MGIVLGFSITYTNTDMETGNLIHLGAELVVQILMLYSASPHARRLTSQLLTGDAFNVDIKLDMEASNRNAEILNVYLKTMGLKLEFTKTPKVLKYPFLINPIIWSNETKEKNDGINPITPINPDEVFDIDKDIERLLKDKNGPINPISIDPIEWEYSSEEEFLKSNKKEG